jgi:tetratricopeptide (TPR) repeat protein
VVLQASNKLRLDEIRQAFLMHLLDPMSIRHAEEIAKKEVLSRFALFAPALSEIYKSNFQLLVSKSLANAVDVRLSGASDADKQTRAERFLKEGFILTPCFYEQLAEYEAQPETFSSYYRELIQNIDPKAEARRLQNTEFVQAQPKPASQPARPQLSKLDRLLNEAEGYFRLEDLEQARAKFEEALAEAGGRNAQAEYGLARVAAFEGEPDLAREHFQKAIALADDTHIRAMSHVYIARIEDLMGNREQAVEHYQLALDVGDPSPRIRELAEGGLEDAFGVDREEDEEQENQQP